MLALTAFDAAHSQSEERWFTLGRSSEGRLPAVAAVALRGRQVDGFGQFQIGRAPVLLQEAQYLQVDAVEFRVLQDRPLFSRQREILFASHTGCSAVSQTYFQRIR